MVGEPAATVLRLLHPAVPEAAADKTNEAKKGQKMPDEAFPYTLSMNSLHPWQ
jgi:hypothetical protein